MRENKPKEVYEIEDLETLKTIADPLRTQIMERLVEAPKTVKEVAAELGLAPSRLYYHINLLEEHALIRVVDRRMIGNLVEKVYRAAAYRFEGASSLLTFDSRQGKDAIGTVFLNILESTREDLLRSLEARSVALEQGAPERPRTAMVNRLVYRISEARAGEFQQRLKALMADFEEAAIGELSESDGGLPDEEETHVYAFTAALYPRFDYSEVEEVSRSNATASDPTTTP